jgi:hypothetical protein
VTSATVTRGARRLSPTSVRRGVQRGAYGARVVGTVVLLMGVVLASPAHAAWLVPGLGGGVSNATLLATPTAPSASVASGTATVTWSASSVIGTSIEASGYVVERIWRGTGPGPQGQEDGDIESVSSGSCAGTVAALSCTTPHGAGETWAYRVSPRFASWSGSESAESSAVRMAATPTVTALALIDAGIAGIVEAGDQIVVTFSEVLDPTSICSGFSSSESGVQTATGMTFRFVGNPNVITVDAGGTCGTSGFGSLQVGGTGNNRYTQGGQSLTTPSSTLTWNPANRTITVTFGSVSGSTTSGSSATVVLTPGALTASGLPIAATPVDSATPQRF